MADMNAEYLSKIELGLCFRICKKQVFSHAMAHIHENALFQHQRSQGGRHRTLRANLLGEFITFKGLNLYKTKPRKNEYMCSQICAFIILCLLDSIRKYATCNCTSKILSLDLKSVFRVNDVPLWAPSFAFKMSLLTQNQAAAWHRRKDTSPLFRGCWGAHKHMPYRHVLDILGGN